MFLQKLWNGTFPKLLKLRISLSNPCFRRDKFWLNFFQKFKSKFNGTFSKFHVSKTPGLGSIVFDFLFLCFVFCVICFDCASLETSSSFSSAETDKSSGDEFPTTEQPGMGAEIRMALSLLVVLGLIAAAVFLLKRLTPYKRLISSSRHPMVLSRVPLGQKKSVCLVRIANEILVIGVTNNNISLLSKINADDFYGEDGRTIHTGMVTDVYGADSTEYRRSFRRILDKLGGYSKRKRANSIE